MKENAAAEAIRIRQEATEAAEAVVRDKIADKVKAVADAQAKIAEAEGKRNAKGDNKRSLREWPVAKESV